MDRDDLKTLANLRLAEANALLSVGLPSGAYYLAGYAVESGLKAIIAGQTRQHDFPDRRRADDSFVHDLEKLCRTAGLNEALSDALGADPRLKRNWECAIEWSVASRYLLHDRNEAQDMLNAVGDETDGVLQWITRYG